MHKRKKITSLKNQHNIKKNCSICRLFDVEAVLFIMYDDLDPYLTVTHLTSLTHTLERQSKTNRFTLSILFTIESNGLGSDASSHSLSLARLLRRPRSIRMNERCVYVCFCTTNLLNIWTMQILCTSSRFVSLRFVSFCMRIRSKPLNHNSSNMKKSHFRADCHLRFHAN